MGLYDELIPLCLAEFDAGQAGPLAIAEALMNHESVIMHCPAHHFIVPAALLTALYVRQNRPRAALERALKTAGERSEKVSGGFCGFQGCCGAAVGCGIFAALLLETNPKKEEHWALVNRFTAQCLAHVASVEGPRCCKRVTYLALAAAMQFPLPGTDFGPVPAITCHRFAQNKECKGAACPFFPRHNRL